MAKPSPSARWIAWAQLLRVSSAPTLVADVWMVLLVSHSGPAPAGVAALATAASLLLYLSGMALNDACDARVDAVERPERPIPSGRVTLLQAWRVGVGLMAAGVAASLWTAWVMGRPDPAILACLLASIIVLYNGHPAGRRMALGLMPMCRVVNLMFVLSVAMDPGSADLWFAKPMWGAILAGLFLYMLGVMRLSRDEAVGGHRNQILVAGAIMALGWGLYAAAPWFPRAPTLRVGAGAWLALWCAAAVFMAWRLTPAVNRPTPRLLQAAVGTALRGLIVADAVLVGGFAGPAWGGAMLGLLALSLLLTRVASPT